VPSGGAQAIAAQTSTLWALALWAWTIWWSTSPCATTSLVMRVMCDATARCATRTDQLLDQAAADKIRNYREPYARNRSLAFLPACLSTSGRIRSEFLRMLYFLADRQASDYFTALGYEPHMEEFCHRRGVYFHQHRCTIGVACAESCCDPWCPPRCAPSCCCASCLATTRSSGRSMITEIAQLESIGRTWAHDGHGRTWARTHREHATRVAARRHGRT
jgi:hypothetical protein